MKYRAELEGQPLAGAGDKGEAPGVVNAGSLDHAKELIALAHGYGHWEQLCREIPDATKITITKVEG